MRRFFQFKKIKNIIFTDGIKTNIKFNVFFEEGSEVDYKKNFFQGLDNEKIFYRKSGKKIERVVLSNVKYSCGQEIESTESIDFNFGIRDLQEISQDEAFNILKEESLDFSILFDKLQEKGKK